MKKTIRIFALALVIVLFAAIPFAAQKTDYQIGESEGGLLNDGKLKDAIQKAVDKFEDWMYEGVPSGYVTQTDDYYLQPFTDGEDKTAAVYVGSDYNSYVMRGPIYEQLESVGGFKTMGRPRSDAFEVNGKWYQNFENGYASVDDSGKAVFVQGSQVDDKGTVSPSTDSQNSNGSASSAGTDSTNDTTDRTDTNTDSMSSPSEMVSDVVSDVEQAAPRWGMWIFIILLLLAVGILAVYWFLKRK